MKTLQVFLSHTSDMAEFPEGRPFVQAALDAVGRARMTPVDMRYFAARDSRPADYCQQQVLACDVYVAVVGFRYGSIVAGEGVSYTEWEFLAAGAGGLPKLVFMLAEEACPSSLADADRSLVEGFRERLSEAGLLVRKFTSSDSLELEVYHALRELASRPTRIHGAFPTLAPRIAEMSGGRGRQAPRRIQQAPRVWNVPTRNADFTGRDAVLRGLREDLVSDRRAAVLAQAIYGLGGVGKTQVALEYAHRFQSDYDLIWWIRAEQLQAINLALAEMARRLGLDAGGNAAETAAFTVDQLRTGAGGRWLLIYDNAEDPADLAPYLPGGAGHVLITSRNHAWTYHARPVELDVFSRRESVAHLMQHVSGLDEDSATKISAAVGDLPLAVEQAAAWLAETGMPAALYIERLEAHTTDALGLSESLGYAAPVAATWDLSLHRLRERSPAAVRLLQILAYCSAEPVSSSLLYGDEMNAALLPFDAALRDKLALGNVIREASRLAMIKVHQGNGSVQMHRLVQAVIRSQLTLIEQDETVHTVHRILAAARPARGHADDPANWPAYDIIWPHLEPSHSEDCDEEDARELLIEWVRYQRVHGQLRSAEILADRLQRQWLERIGQAHETLGLQFEPANVLRSQGRRTGARNLDTYVVALYKQTLTLQFELANVLRSQGRLTAARDLDTQVLAHQRAVLGAAHPDALASANSLAADLRALGDFRRALALDRKTYSSFKRQLGAADPGTLNAASNLACSLRQAGNFPAARRLDEQALEHRRTLLGPSHPDTLYSAASLGHDLRETGALHDSVRLLRTTHDMCGAVLGNETPRALLTAKSLAVSLRRTGELDDAMQLTQETYDRYLKRYGPENPDALSCALNLACDYSAHGDHTQALKIAADVHASYRQSLGASHLFTLAAANNLVIYLRRIGDLPRALKLAEDTADAMRTSLGHDHPFTLSCVINLASCLGDARNLDQAETLQREAVTVLQKVRGKDHPDKLVCQAGLAVTLQNARIKHSASQIRAQVLAKLDEVLGPQHPENDLLRKWQYINSEIEPPPI